MGKRYDPDNPPKMHGTATRTKPKGYRQHPTEYKLKVIDLVNEGKSMSSVARDEGIAVSQVKYWMDNEERIKGPAKRKDLTFEDGLSDYTAKRFHNEGWSAITVAMQAAKKIMRKNDATLSDVTRFVDVMVEKLHRYGKPANRNKNKAGQNKENLDPMDKAMDEMSIIVAKFTRRKRINEAQDNVTTNPPKETSSSSLKPALIDVKSEPPERPDEEPSK